ncbi:MFS transporter [Sphingoaurantiacus capsulatus]|uniref:MFS transporter n=1 Tax=Sphingoaurantiacus capsulatus TaxID=1771310 RepID=A0ABV7XEC0_9SPHN
MANGNRLPAGAVAWALFEGVRVPYVVLVTIYVFMPYFATVVIGDPVEGQAAVAQYGKIGGWIVALTAPFLGAAVDRMGPRKPWLGAITTLMVALAGLLWWTLPDGAGLSIPQVVTIAAALTILYAYGEMLHNSLLPRAAPGQEHLASGLGLALGNAVSMTMLVFVLWAFVLPGKVAWPIIPPAPLFGLDAAAHEPDRIVAPLVALVLAIGCLPLFFLTPDAPRTGLGPVKAFAAGAGDLKRLFTDARRHRNALTFLVARMLYADGKLAILLFGGIFAAGVMRWGTLELLAYGIILSIVAVIGGFVGAWFDGKLGPKRAIQIELVLVIFSQLAVLGGGRERILYQPAAPEVLWDAPMFRTVPELAFLGVALAGAIGLTAAYSSSRTLLVKLVPEKESGVFFGLYALSGNATYWLAPLLVEIFTRAYGTQQAGFYPVIGLLLIGLALLSFVKPPAARD